MPSAEIAAPSDVAVERPESQTPVPRVGLPPALDGERETLDGKAGLLTLYASAPKTREDHAVSGVPLLLVHSINAAGSSYEMKPVYDQYGATRPVYSLDLPGFGFSERSERDYTPRLMTDAIHAAIDRIRERHGDAPIDAMAGASRPGWLRRSSASMRP